MRIGHVLGLMCLSGALQAAEVQGVLGWSQRVELSPRVSGVVHKVEVVPGQRVKKGQLLLALDARSYRARAEEARAALARLGQEAEETGKDLKRAQELYDRGVTSTSELDQARLRATRATSLQKEAEARLRLAQHDLDDASLRAPFDAVVLERKAEAGQNVVVGLQPPPLLVLARDGEMRVRFFVAADKVASLKPGTLLPVAVGGRRFEARLRNVGLEPSGKEGYAMEAVFPVAEPLPAGSPATLMLP
jgi:RND family efflux transporter MFP subunit